MEQEAEAARKTLGLQTEEDKKRAQFADELERKRHVDQVPFLRKYRRLLDVCEVYPFFSVLVIHS